jgi:uncharacterized cupin superfamily protein
MGTENSTPVSVSISAGAFATAAIIAIFAYRERRYGGKMDPITLEHNPSPMKLDVMNVDSWPIWTKEVSRFEWAYDTEEVCYILEGEATITPEGGQPVTIKARDLVHFPAGMKCTWEVISPLRKHYRLG